MAHGIRPEDCRAVATCFSAWGQTASPDGLAGEIFDSAHCRAQRTSMAEKQALGKSQLAARLNRQGFSNYIALCYIICVARTWVEDALREIAADHDGLFTAGEAKQAGVSQPVIVQLAARGRLNRLSRGLYAFPTWPTTTHRQYHEAVLWPQAH